MNGASDKFEKYLREKDVASVSGSGIVHVGEATVKIAGSGKYIAGELLKAAGSVKVEGSLKLRIVKISGAFKVEGDLECEELKLSGAGVINGECKCKEIKIVGAFKTRKLLTDILKIGGAIKTPVLEGGDVHIILNGNSEIDRLKAKYLEVKREEPTFRVMFWDVGLKRKDYYLISESIEINKGNLEAVKCKRVRGDEITIGRFCEIDVVEYTISAKLLEGAKVGRLSKIG